MAFGAIVGFTLYLAASGKDFAEVLPSLSLFALAGYRLMPSLNLAYTSIAQMLANFPAIDHIYQDIQAIEKAPVTEEKSISFDREITLKAV